MLPNLKYPGTKGYKGINLLVEDTLVGHGKYFKLIGD